MSAAEALLSGENARLQQLTARVAPLQQERAARLPLLIERYNALWRTEVLKDSGHLPALDSRSSSSAADVVRAAQAMQDEARDVNLLCKAAKSYVKRMTARRGQLGGACPCCCQTMTAAVEVQYVESMTEMFKATVDPA